ncbi:Uncharacterised protein [Streptococcus pneumoniae]|nr:Uncharacterised protein [Streptococcus pneumoniae]
MVCFFSFYTLRKSLQTTSGRLAVYMVTDFVSSIHNLKAVRQSYLQPQNSVLRRLWLAA